MQEQLYNDFTTKLLPQIQEGLVISKEYFADLFGRYVNFLIAYDILSIVISLAIMGIVIKLAFIFSNKESSYYDEDLSTGIIIGAGFITIIAFVSLIDSIFDLIKVIYVPELRIYEELSYLR